MEAPIETPTYSFLSLDNSRQQSIVFVKDAKQPLVSGEYRTTRKPDGTLDFRRHDGD